MDFKTYGILKGKEQRVLDLWNMGLTTKIIADIMSEEISAYKIVNPEQISSLLCKMRNSGVDVSRRDNKRLTKNEKRLLENKARKSG
jgi:hypothetical protein